MKTRRDSCVNYCPVMTTMMVDDEKDYVKCAVTMRAENHRL